MRMFGALGSMSNVAFLKEPLPFGCTGQAASHTEKAVQIAGAVHGRDHPIMESYWQAVAEAKQAVRI